MNRRGAVLIICYMVIVALSLLAGAFLTRSISERSITSKYFDSTQAFWLAEAGISRGINDFKTNGSFQGISDTPLGPGGYRVEWDSSKPGIIQSHGFIPFNAPYGAERIIELNLPFYGATIYTAGNIDTSGGAYSVTGDVVYGGNIGPPTNPNPHPNITGVVTHDPSIDPLDLLDLQDFNTLKTISINQGNYNSPYGPTSYWYNETLGIPNVVYLEGDLTLKGGDSVHGFFVVGGAAVCNVEIKGNVSVNGCIYTCGDFTVHGGGFGLNISGGVWSGGDTNLNGSIDIQYNAGYVAGLLKLDINPNYKKIWRETQNPY